MKMCYYCEEVGIEVISSWCSSVLTPKTWDIIGSIIILRNEEDQLMFEMKFSSKIVARA